MTARATTLRGVDVGAYYIEALPNYYLDSGEPKGNWHGRGAVRLGLEGEIIDGEFLRIMAGLHPRIRGDAHLGRPYTEDSVRGFDVTASAPKSVSTLFAIGDAHTRAHALAAHDTAVATVVDWIEAHAHTRYRINGRVSIVDAEGTIAATFRQHTSRALDPQLHTHIVIANRVRSPDGRWLALDARSLKLDQRTVSAIYHATLRSQLTARLGVEWEPVVNGIAEIAHVPPGGARGVLGPHRRCSASHRREARPVHRHLRPRPDSARALAPRTRSRHRQPPTQEPRRQRRRPAPRLDQAHRGTRPDT